MVCRPVLFDLIAEMFQNFVVIPKNSLIQKLKPSLIIIIYYVITYI